MTNPELNATIAELLGESDHHYVMKRGMYYRPNAHGYTYEESQAWRLPLAEAQKHEQVGPYVIDPVTIKKCPPRDFAGSLDVMATAEAQLYSDVWTFYTHAVLCRTVWAKNPCNDDDEIRTALLSASAPIRAQAFIDALKFCPNALKP